ncbi:ATP-binding protein [Fontivita pretiosa]|uniref:ATP-binding protein n=1 Tax=Fontivita pretiosa TaxID=2989684 RepID=UPI003D183299
MTRRIAIAILLTAWAALLAGAVGTYLAARRALLAELDEALIGRAAALPRLLGVEASPAGAAGVSPLIPTGDRYLIRDALGRVVARPPADLGNAPRLEVISRNFAQVGDGTRVRNIAVRIRPDGVKRDGRGGDAVTIVYSGSAQNIDRLLSRLAGLLAMVGIISAALTALVAMRISRQAVRPIRAAADTIASIDDSTLNRRIDVSSLPQELKPMGERLNQMLQKLEHGLKQRQRFLWTAAHELRTPVTALRTTLEVTLHRPRAAAELTEAMSRCLTDVRQLGQLVETLLQQARMEQSESHSRLERTDLAQVLHRCADVAAALGEARGIRIQRQFADQIPCRTDPQRIHSIVTNLLSNAVEHSREGSSVTLSCQKRDSEVELTVSDCGGGIAAEHLPHLFEPFYRVESAAQAAGDGKGAHLGIGLFLVQSHVKALGGRCEVDSQPGKGTRVRVMIPVQEPADSSSPHVGAV